MDANRFDAVSRAFADRTSRRRALRRLGGGGLAGGVLAAFGLRTVAAQGDEVRTCRLAFDAIVAVGPNQGQAFRGELTLGIGPEGAIDDGTFATEEGDEHAAVGQATGRALDLRIALDDERALTLAGTGEREIELCRGRIAGLFAGPDEGDLGTWGARRGKQPSPTPAASGGGGSSGSAGSAPPPTPTPVPAGSGGTDSGGGGEECPVPVPCGDTCCYETEVCNERNHLCYCPDGTETCQNVCRPLCPGTQHYDPATCECGCPPGWGVCTDLCVDLQNDPLSCGDCGVDCTALGDGSTCVNGVCDCPPGWIRRPDGLCVEGPLPCPEGQQWCGDACADVLNDPVNCGACGVVCGDYPGYPGSGQGCTNGFCYCGFTCAGTCGVGSGATTGPCEDPAAFCDSCATFG
jgi:hypothetical protein